MRSSTVKSSSFTLHEVSRVRYAYFRLGAGVGVPQSPLDLVTYVGQFLRNWRSRGGTTKELAAITGRTRVSERRVYVEQTNQMTDMFTGKKGLITGVFNKQSIAWAIAERIIDERWRVRLHLHARQAG